MFRRTNNHCKRALEAAKLAYTNETKDSTTLQKLSTQDFWQIGNSVLNKSKFAMPPLFNGLEVLPSAYLSSKIVS